MEETKWSEQISRGGSDNTNSINSPKPNIHIKKLIDSRAKISQRVIYWRPTSQMDWKKWMTLKRKVLKLFEFKNFSFQSCSIFQSVWMVGRQWRTFYSTFWNFCPAAKTLKIKCRFFSNCKPSSKSFGRPHRAQGSQLCTTAFSMITLSGHFHRQQYF